MTKNIAVVDANGNEYEATYPKRAKGLVKNGRARFVNETTICLVRPPSYMEGQKMNTDELLNKLNEAAAAPDEKSQPDAAYIMEKIDRILDDMEYLSDAVAALEETAGEKLACLSSMIEAREKTNQATIGLLNNMLDKVMAPADPDTQKFAMLLDYMKHKNLNEEGAAADVVKQIVEHLF